MFYAKKCPQCHADKQNVSFYRKHKNKLNYWWIRGHLSRHQPPILYRFVQYVHLNLSMFLQNNGYIQMQQY